MGNYSRDTTEKQTPWLQDHHLQRHLTVDSKVGSVVFDGYLLLACNAACRRCDGGGNAARVESVKLGQHQSNGGSWASLGRPSKPSKEVGGPRSHNSDLEAQQFSGRDQREDGMVKGRT
ncbi:unnamed protein product [Jaminaea pallidilutea]